MVIMGDHARRMSICVGCGLCCDGTMFHATDLGPTDDRAGLERLGAVFVIDRESDRFLQPCPAARGGLCIVHDDRPTMCREFECDLLVAVERGAVDPAAAHEVIATAIELRDRVRPALESLTDRPSPVADLDPTGVGGPPPAIRVSRRSIPGLRNGLLARVGDTDRAALPTTVRETLDATDELLDLLRDRFGLGD